jgi:hypothetical protein
MENFAAQHSYALYNRYVKNTTYRKVLPSTIDGKPLPKVPISPPNMLSESSLRGAEDSSTPYGDRTPSDQSIAPNRFSFLPGDDYGILPTGKQTTTNAVQGYTNPKDQRPSESGTSITTESYQNAQTRTSHRPKQTSKPEGKLGHSKPNKPDKGTQPTREDSQSSIITVIRDDSGQSGKAQESCNRDLLERPKLKRRNEINEAKIAAVRALSGTERNTMTRSRNSGAQDEGQRVESSSIDERKEAHIVVNKGLRGIPKSQGV